MPNLPKNLSQAEMNELFNIRLSNIERFLPNLIVNFENCVVDEDAINSTELTAARKVELTNSLVAIKNAIKKK